ncbi:MAG: putative metal-binding motif-containing protein [Deltaproteobacteria bacterium]|nr:putative metal-binding motif-containing protein [Deltaproteobacteria bacterium]
MSARALRWGLLGLALSCAGADDSAAPLLDGSADAGGVSVADRGPSLPLAVGPTAGARSPWALPARVAGPGAPPAVDSGADDVRSADTGAPDGDPDGDGWSTAAGDCDPARADVHPGAPEACDGVDQDCDGAVDEVGAEALVHSPAKNEGATWTATVWPTGCAEAAAMVGAPPPAVADCGLLDAQAEGRAEVAASPGGALTVSCALINEGALVLDLELHGPGAPARLRLVGEATNVPPEVLGDARPLQVVLEPTGDSGLALAAPAARVSRVFRRVDLGQNDAVTWALEGAPPHMEIDQGGVLRFAPDEADLGAHRVVVQATDDAGGVGELALYVDVSRSEDADGGLGCCCFGATAGLGLPAFSLLRRRRRRTPDPSAAGAASTPRPPRGPR